MAVLQLKVGDKALVTGHEVDGHCFHADDEVTVMRVDVEDNILPYGVEDAQGNWGWMTPAQLTPLNETVELKLDLHTVNHIHSYYSNIIQEAAEADKSHEAINIALLGYIEGLKDGLSNG